MQLVISAVALILSVGINIRFGESYPSPYSSGATSGGGTPGGYPSSSFPGSPSVPGLPSPTSNSQSSELGSNSGNTGSSWNNPAVMTGTNSTISLYQQQQPPGAIPPMAGLSQNPYANGLPSMQSGENPNSAASAYQTNPTGAQAPMQNLQNSMANPMSSLAAGGPQSSGGVPAMGMNMLGFGYNNPYSMVNPMSSLSPGGPPPGGGGPSMGMNTLGSGYNNPYSAYNNPYFGSGARLGMPGSNPFGGGGMSGMYPMPGMPSPYSMFGQMDPYFGGGGMSGGMSGMYPMPGMNPYSMFGQMNPYFGGYGSPGSMPGSQTPFMNGPGNGVGNNPMAQYG